MYLFSPDDFEWANLPKPFYCVDG